MAVEIRKVSLVLRIETNKGTVATEHVRQADETIDEFIARIRQIYERAVASVNG